jgi:hypothetical protein
MSVRTPSLFEVATPQLAGSCFDPALDHARLMKQLGRVFDSCEHILGHVDRCEAAR